MNFQYKKLVEAEMHEYDLDVIRDRSDDGDVSLSVNVTLKPDHYWSGIVNGALLSLFALIVFAALRANGVF